MSHQFILLNTQRSACLLPKQLLREAERTFRERFRALVAICLLLARRSALLTLTTRILMPSRIGLISSTLCSLSRTAARNLRISFLSDWMFLRHRLSCTRAKVLPFIFLNPKFISLSSMFMFPSYWTILPGSLLSVWMFADMFSFISDQDLSTD